MPTSPILVNPSQEPTDCRVDTLSATPPILVYLQYLRILKIVRWIHYLLHHAYTSYPSLPIFAAREYNAILLIPDIYHRPHIKELMNVLLVRMGFGAALVHQESVCASYGSGLSSACVVDVGDHKTAVTCVEDGISHRNTRICLAYGGRDITRCFTWLLERARFPYIECNPNRIMDTLLLIELKETFCHLDQDFDGPQLLDFHVSFPNQPTFMYKMNLGEETMIAPMGSFIPKYLESTEKKLRSPSSGIKETQRTSMMKYFSFKPKLSRNSYMLNIASFNLFQTPKARVASDETKKKMYGNILVVGGGISFYQGATEMLRHRIQSLMSPSLSKSVEKIEVICKTKDD
ncbi:putative actin-related protein 8 [Apostichopus japonicus]|uniref:Putative actin-related protein 8 n=1 Tax=Stichopus japonicus TaxID=307972 RepID=A0A2G8LR99_STIJA|nr:putative actin-related protein 8 [Apostichopus japonicus]